MGVEASHIAGAYQEPQLAPGVLEVRVSVYKLELTGVGLLDHIGASLAGTYHTGLVVGGKEYAFGGHDDPIQTGVYTTPPELNKDYMFHQRIVMGRVEMPIATVNEVIGKFAASPQWLGTAYDLIEHNCNHFVSDLCWALVRTRPPEWINDTAESICLDRRRHHREQVTLTKAMVKYRATFSATSTAPWDGEHKSMGQEPKSMESKPEALRTTVRMFESGPRTDGGVHTVKDLPGGKAFEDTFSVTFGLVWKRRYGEFAKSRSTCPMDVDPTVHRRELEGRTLQGAAKAAEAAAVVAAHAARKAQKVRQLVEPGDALTAWDSLWASRSSSLLRSWQEDAAQGVLDQDPDSKQGLERDEQVRRALDEATAAAQDAMDPTKNRSCATRKCQQRLCAAHLA